MRVLHVVPTYLPAVRYGGPIHSVHGLCAALAARGHEVHVFTTNVDGPGDSPVPLGRPVEMDGVHVWYFQSRWLRRLYWAPGMARALRREVQGFDLVHLHSVFLWPTWAAARLATVARVPYILSPRGMLVEALVRSRSRLAKTAWMALIERANVRRAAAIHVTSSIEGEELKRFDLRLPSRIVVVPNGVAIAPPVEIAKPAAEPYVLMLGRISWKKRIDLALEALAGVEGIRLVVAGGDDEGLTASLRDRAAALGVSARVEFVGPLHGDRKRQALGGALALLMPSFSENFGNSVLEAMAEGIPAIVVPQVGAAEIVRSSGGGLVVEPNAPAIGNAIRVLRDDPPLRARMGERAMAEVGSRYSWHAVAEQMENEYLALLKNLRKDA